MSDEIALESVERMAMKLPPRDAWLADCDAVAEAVEGEFDSTADLRAIRE